MYKRIFLTITMLVALVLLGHGPATAFAASGDLDTTFGDGGHAELNIAGSTADDSLSAVVLRSDGTIFAAGNSIGHSPNPSPAPSGELARFTAQGQLDAGFGASYQPGRLSLNIGAGGNLIQDMLLLPDGKLLVSATGSFALARFNPDGTLDPGFGSGGWITDTLGLTQMVRLGNGKIVALAASYTDFVLRRFSANGSLDTTFGVNGTVVTDIGSPDEAFDIIVATGDKLVVSGYSAHDFAVVRYNANGSLDTTFDGDGIVTTDMGSDTDWGYSVVMQPGGKLIVGGRSGDSFALARYKTNGALDPSFSGDGKLLITFPQPVRGSRLALQPDGKILVNGISSIDQLCGIIMRFNADGSPDNSFGTGGYTLFPYIAAISEIVVRTDGKILEGGFSYQGSNRVMDFVLMQINADGTPDKSFGSPSTPGISHAKLGRGSDLSYATAVQSDDKTLVGGLSGGYFSLARLNSDGTPDSSFGFAGRVITGISTTATRVPYDLDLVALAIQPDGKILMACSLKSLALNLLRFNPDGSPDTTFNGSGLLTLQRPVEVIGVGLALQTNGSILLASGFNGDIAVTRLLTSGKTDTSFGSGGWTVADPGAFGSFAGMALQGGKIVLAGTSASDVVVMRLQSTGALDQTFGSGGKVVTNVVSNDEAAYALAVQVNGRILVAGRTYQSGRNQAFALRYTSNGALDTTFSGDGKQLVDFGAYGGWANTILPQADGKVVLGGLGGLDPYGPSRFALARLTSTGNLDSGFGSGGLVTSVFGVDNAIWITGLALTGSGKIVATGPSINQNPMVSADSDFLVARYSNAIAAPTKPAVKSDGSSK